MDSIAEKKSFNALSIVHKSDHRGLSKLFVSYGSWSNAFHTVGGNVDADRAWEDLARAGVRLLSPSDEEFPDILKEIPWPPHALYAKGAVMRRDACVIAIVGTRKATDEGKKIARQFAEELVREGCVVASGLALGIDAAAHEGALLGKGMTIAVLAGGLENIYPRQNERLGEEMLSNGGTILSEYPIGTPTLPMRFIERNRIVSGLSRGILVVEAPRESGALATAKFALEQNREVFVVPGPLRQEQYAGSHALIQGGAALVTSVADILEVFPEFSVARSLARSESISASLDPNEAKLLALLESAGSPLAVDKIQELSTMDMPQVNRCLGALVVKGLVQEDSGKYYL